MMRSSRRNREQLASIGVATNQTISFDTSLVPGSKYPSKSLLGQVKLKQESLH